MIQSLRITPEATIIERWKPRLAGFCAVLRAHQNFGSRRERWFMLFSVFHVSNRQTSSRMPRNNRTLRCGVVFDG